MAISEFYKKKLARKDLVNQAERIKQREILEDTLKYISCNKEIKKIKLKIVSLNIWIYKNKHIVEKAERLLNS